MEPETGRSGLAAVAIGRNEGERLKACIRSMQPHFQTIVYVDSGSSDGSVTFAMAQGCRVVELDMSVPFTAARARNAGVARLLAVAPDVEIIQLVDGDSIIAADWPGQAVAFLQGNSKVAVVTGQIREQAPERTVYNAVFDIEWRREPGEIKGCAGTMMVRRAAFEAVGGFNETVIAAEDDEMCARLRKMSWGIQCIDVRMATHDANMTRFSQWWKRSVRTGHGFAEVDTMHPGHFTDMVRKVLVWAVALPLAAIVAGLWSPWALLAVLALYPVAYVRNLTSLSRGGMPFETARVYAALLLVAKFSNLVGFFKYYARRLLQRDRTIIEYK